MSAPWKGGVCVGSLEGGLPCSLEACLAVLPGRGSAALRGAGRAALGPGESVGDGSRRVCRRGYCHQGARARGAEAPGDWDEEAEGGFLIPREALLVSNLLCSGRLRRGIRRYPRSTRHGAAGIQPARSPRSLHTGGQAWDSGCCGSGRTKLCGVAHSTRRPGTQEDGVSHTGPAGTALCEDWASLSSAPGGVGERAGRSRCRWWEHEAQGCPAGCHRRAAGEDSGSRTRASLCRQDPAKSRALGRGVQGAGGARRQAEQTQVECIESEEDETGGC